MSVTIEGKRILVTGGTGSLGRRIVARLLSGAVGRPRRVTVMSRDEAKQHHMRLRLRNLRAATDELIYGELDAHLAFRIGDVRDADAITAAVRDADLIVHAAALKQVPTCEYFPIEAVQTNVLGTAALVRAARAAGAHVEAVVGISTDKACKPVNVMGMTKALMERVLVEANIGSATRFSCVRYGNVIASRGSVVPLFYDQMARGGPLTVTSDAMTRFLITREQAVDAVLAALVHGGRGDVLVPKMPTARVIDVARAVIGERPIPIDITGVRPGEKIHEILISEEERSRTTTHESHFVVSPMLPELGAVTAGTPQGLTGEYSSEKVTLDQEGVRLLLESDHGLRRRAAEARKRYHRGATVSQP